MRAKITKQLILSSLLVGGLMSLPVTAIIIRHDRDEAKPRELGRRYSSGLVHVGGLDEGTPKYVEIAGMEHYFEHAASQRESMERRKAPPRTPPQFHELAFAGTLNRLKQNLNYSQSSAPASEPAAPNYSIADFQNLRWLEGDWHGTENGKNDFYERYSFVNDNRIEMQSFTDATMRQTGGEKSSTFLKDGAIYHQAGRGVWVAERLSKIEIAFAPKENVRNSFVWKRQSPDVWTAEINFTGRGGHPKRTIYRLERIKKSSSNL